MARLRFAWVYNLHMINRAVLALLAVAAVASAQSKLQLKVHTGKGVNGYDVNSTMISGEKDMLVIDPQFSLSEAHRLTAEILESKKNLTTIYMTHPHPDHLFGLAVLHVGVSLSENCGASGHRRRGQNRMAGAAEILVPDIRHQYPRTGAGPAGGTGESGADAGRRGISDHGRGAGRRPGQQLRLHPFAAARW